MTKRTSHAQMQLAGFPQLEYFMFINNCNFTIVGDYMHYLCSIIYNNVFIIECVDVSAHLDRWE